jgi:hypothetical protein
MPPLRGRTHQKDPRRGEASRRRRRVACRALSEVYRIGRSQLVVQFLNLVRRQAKRRSQNAAEAQMRELSGLKAWPV